MISAVVIALNEERNIGDCVSALKKLTDDVILLDSGSTDNTVQIAEKCGAKVYKISWQGYGKTKNLAPQFAQFPWILSIDADEVLTDALIHEIKNTSLDPKHVYAINILTNYCGYWIRHSGWFPSFKKRLYHSSFVRWDDREVHENLTWEDDIKVVNFENILHHYSYRTAEDHERKADKYARLGAEHLITSNKKVGLLKQFFGPYYRFFRMYILKLGFLDKKAGFLLALREAKMVAMRYQYYRSFRQK